MSFVEVSARRLSDEEAEEYRLQEEDFRWWSQQPLEPYIGKYVAVVNREVFVGDTWEEAEQRALATYPHHRPVVEYVPRVKGPSFYDSHRPVSDGLSWWESSSLCQS